VFRSPALAWYIPASARAMAEENRFAGNGDGGAEPGGAIRQGDTVVRTGGN
jgi:hypothetical protein